jgi:DNA-binding transcriptional regulator YiaG
MLTNDDLKAARCLLKESQAAFAVRFGVNQTTITRWEKHGLPRGGPTRNFIGQILHSIKQSEAAE